MRPVITELRVEEPARFNPEKLEDLCKRIGDTQAEAEVALALERIAAFLDTLPEVTARCTVAELASALDAVIADADLIGMATLGRVTRDVRACLDSGDTVALAATLSRLDRVGDRSIHAVWDLEDASG